MIALIMGVLIGALLVDQATAAPEEAPPEDPPVSQPLKVLEQNVDTDGSIAVHEQGVVPVKNEDGGSLLVTVAKEPVLLGAQVSGFADQHAEGKALRERGTTDDYVVPDGKQLVIEYVSLETFDEVVSGSDAYSAFIGWRFVSNRNFVGRVTSETSFTGFGPESGELVSIRVPAGETPDVSIFANFDVLVNITVSGYLEPMP